MIGIILHHYSVHCGYSYTLDGFGYNSVIMQIASLFGKLACNIFMIITGYFMVKSKVNIKKIIMLIGQTLFYSLGIVLVLRIFNLYEFKPWDYFKMLFPYIYGNWFIITYLLIYILSPYINDMISSIDRGTLKKFIISMIILFSFIPSSFVFSGIQVNNTIILVMMYIIGGYLRLYIKTGPKVMYKRLMLISFLAVFAYVAIYDILGVILKKEVLINKAIQVNIINSIIMVICSVFTFLHFANNYDYHSKVINKIATTTLGIYLLHDSDFTRSLLWNKLSPNYTYFFSKGLILHMIIKCACVFVIGCIIDLIRAKVFEKPFAKLVNKLDKKYTEKIAGKYNSLIDKIEI